MQPIKPGESHTYEFVVRNAGTYWYHPHVDSATQISKGLYGALIVDARTPGTKFDQEYTLFMGEWNVPIVSDSEGTAGMKMGGGMNDANYYTINGKSAPAIPNLKVRKGQRILIRFINAGNQVHPMHIHGHAFTVIGTDGYPLPTPFRKDTLAINAGERYDAILEADNPGTWAFHCHDLHHVMNNGVYPGGLLQLVQYER